MNPNDVAKALLNKLDLPKSAASVMLWHEDNTIVMRVLIDRNYLATVHRISTFEGYPVFFCERDPAIAFH